MAAAPGRVPRRMNYENFADVSKRHRVIYQNWPVEFIPPSRLTVLELHALHTILHSENPPTLFRKLTNAQWALLEDHIIANDGKCTLQLPPADTPVLPNSHLLTGLTNPATPPDTPVTPPDAPAPPPGTEHDIAMPHTSSQSLNPGVSGTVNTPADVQPAVPAPPLEPTGPGPRGGTRISFNDKPAPKSKKTRKTAAQKEAAKKTQMLQKEVEKAQNAAKSASKKAGAAAKKSNRRGKGGKKTKAAANDVNAEGDAAV